MSLSSKRYTFFIIEAMLFDISSDLFVSGMLKISCKQKDKQFATNLIAETDTPILRPSDIFKAWKPPSEGGHHGDFNSYSSLLLDLCLVDTKSIAIT